MATKTELISSVAEKTKVTKAVIEDVLEAIMGSLVASDKTTLKGFGTFEWKTKKARTGRNPKTGAVIDIPESTTLHFKPSHGLKWL